MPDLSPWAHNSLTYDGCCSHFSINEKIIRTVGHNESTTPEEVNRVVAERKLSKGRLVRARKGPGVHAAEAKAYAEKALDALVLLLLVGV